MLETFVNIEYRHICLLETMNQVFQYYSIINIVIKIIFRKLCDFILILIIQINHTN